MARYFFSGPRSGGAWPPRWPAPRAQSGPGRVPVLLKGCTQLEGYRQHGDQQVLGRSRIDAAGEEAQERRSVPVEMTPKPRASSEPAITAPSDSSMLSCSPVPPIPVRAPVKDCHITTA